MTAAERAHALAQGKPIECPQCDQQLAVRNDVFGTLCVCPECGLEAGPAMVCLMGKPGDDSAALILEVPRG